MFIHFSLILLRVGRSERCVQNYIIILNIPICCLGIVFCGLSQCYSKYLSFPSFVLFFSDIYLRSLHLVHTDLFHLRFGALIHISMFPRATSNCSDLQSTFLFRILHVLARLGLGYIAHMYKVQVVSNVKGCTGLIKEAAYCK